MGVSSKNLPQPPSASLLEKTTALRDKADAFERAVQKFKKFPEIANGSRIPPDAREDATVILRRYTSAIENRIEVHDQHARIKQWDMRKTNELKSTIQDINQKHSDLVKISNGYKAERDRYREDIVVQEYEVWIQLLRPKPLGNLMLLPVVDMDDHVGIWLWDRYGGQRMGNWGSGQV